MVTFRKDIHLGRRVPMTPKDEDQCMLVSISNEGLAVDKYGRKWQFVAFEERTVMPIIEIVDVTTDATMGGFDPVNYPRIAGKKGGVYRITITEGEEDCTLWYKILKYNEELDIFVEPSDWTQYTDPIVLKARGRYCIKAYASQDGHKNSLEVQSDNFQVTQRVLKYNYAISIGQYGLVYNYIPANGGTVTPKTLSYSIVSTVVSTDPDYNETQSSGSGATAVFSGLDADPNTGELTWEGHNDNTVSVVVGSVTVALSYEIPEIDRYGVDPATDYIISANGQAPVSQLGKENGNRIIWDNVPPSTITAGDSVRFAAHALEGEVTFEDGEGSAISSPLENVQSNITIVAKVGATTHYVAKSDSKTVRVNAPQVTCKYALSRDGSAPAPSTSTDITSPNVLYTRTGSFSSGSQIDCSELSGTNSRYKMSWFAVPKENSLKIETVSAGDNITSSYTTSIIGDYKVYIQTYGVGDWMQDVIRLTIM